MALLLQFILLKWSDAKPDSDGLYFTAPCTSRPGSDHAWSKGNGKQHKESALRYFIYLNRKEYSTAHFDTQEWEWQIIS
jgi:hypothetical protein